jgi:curved DNA binding protein
MAWFLPLHSSLLPFNAIHSYISPTTSPYSAVAKEFKGKDIEKGIAVPTCISINNTVGHFCPMPDNTLEFKEGDLVKIDMGCHIDGFIAQSGHTIVISSEPIKGRAADVVQCAATCFEAAARLIKPGKSLAEVSGPLNTIAEAYGCNLVEGVFSHKMRRFLMDDNKVVINKPAPDQRNDDDEVEEGEVWSIDIVVSTGEGKPKLLDDRETTVYKRAVGEQYQLKMKASRELLSEINRKAGYMQFSLRSIENEKAKYGIVECLNHNLLVAYPVMYEKQGDLVAQFKGTILMTPNGSDRITTAPLQKVESDKEVGDESIKELLATSLKNKKKKKKSGKEGTPMAD